MANYFEEGKTSSTGKSASDNETIQWLKTNNLSHLIPVFENGLSLSELAEMPKSELTEILEAMGLNKIDLIRVRSKIVKYNEQSQPPPPPHLQSKPQRVIITEAETAALESLDKKHKELTVENKSIQDRLSEFEAEYRKQEKFIHDTFKEIQSNIDKRKNILLNEMKIKSDEYRQKLSVHIKAVANQRSVLSQIKQKCENDINHSNVSSLAQATQRANKSVALIDETLLSLAEPTEITPGIFVRCDIAKTEINDKIRTLGRVSMVGHKPPVPTFNIVTLYPNGMTIELLTDQNFSSAISKYEMQMKSAKKVETHNKTVSMLADYALNIDDTKDYNVSVVDINESNIAFHQFQSLRRGSKYKIRARGLLENGESGEWTEWLVLQTPSPTPQGYYGKISLDSKKQSLNVNEWLTFCNQKNVTLTLYQQRRIYYYVKTVLAKKRRNNMVFTVPMIAAPIQAFEEFIADTSFFHSGEWRNMKREIREKGSVQTSIVPQSTMIGNFGNLNNMSDSMSGGYGNMHGGIWRTRETYK